MAHGRNAAAALSAAALATALSVSGTAMADESTTIARQGSRTAIAGLDATSDIIAGYSAPLGKKKEISGVIEVPRLDCTKGDSGIISIVELANDENYSDGNVYTFCVGGQLTINPTFESVDDGQTPIDKPVRAGDKLRVTSKVLKNGKHKITMENLKRDWTASKTLTGFVVDDALFIDWTMTSGGEPLAVPAYGKHEYTKATVSGKDLRRTKETKIVMVDDDGDNLLVPGKIRNGTDFFIESKA